MHHPITLLHGFLSGKTVPGVVLPSGIKGRPRSIVLSTWFLVGMSLFLFIPLFPHSTRAAQSRVWEAKGRFGAVSTGHPLASRAALRILERGGNAVDAALAAAFTLGVVDFSNSGLGGDGFALVRLPDGRVEAWDGSAPPPRAGLASESHIGFPAVPRLLLMLLSEYGSKGLPEIMAPAIRYAERGFPCSPYLESVIGTCLQFLEDPAATGFLFPGGKPLRAGETFRQPLLAATLIRFAEDGGTSFFSGEDARTLVADMTRRGAKFTLQDLENFRPKKCTPIELCMGEWRLVGTPVPSSAVAVMALAETLLRQGADPCSDENLDSPLEALKGLLRLKKIRLAECLARENLFLAWNRLGPDRFCPPFAEKADDESDPPENTTHLVVWDRSGMIVSMTLTLGNHFGTGEFSPLGFFYNNEGRNFRPLVAIYPTNYPRDAGPISAKAPIILFRGTQPVLAIGGAGGNRIISNLASIIVSFIRHRDLKTAVFAPRASVTENGKVRIEWSPDPKLGTRTQKEWRSVSYLAPGSDHFGLVSAISSSGEELLAVGDYHRDGSAAALSRDPDAPRRFNLSAFVFRKKGLESVSLAQPVSCPRQKAGRWESIGQGAKNLARSDSPTLRFHADSAVPLSALHVQTSVTILPDKPLGTGDPGWDNPARWSRKPVLKPREREFWKRIPRGLSGKSLIEWLMVEIGHAIPFDPERGRMNAEELLARGKGDCSGKARLFDELARSAGIPCRLVGGILLEKGLKEETHIWNEVFLDGKWTPVCTVNHLFGRLPANWLVLRYGDEKTLEESGKVVFRIKEVKIRK